MRRSWCVVALASLLVLAWASAMWADDAYPPPWRGQEGTTYARWEFLTPDPNPVPDQEINPNGPSQTVVTPGPGMEWLQNYDGRIGVWPLSGSIVITIPNYPPPKPLKYIWVQLTWEPQSPGYPTITELLSGIEGTKVDERSGSPWLRSTFVIDLRPNPQYEVVSIEGTIYVDEVIVDTICVPEPSSLLALAGSLFGLAGVVLRRRRR